MWVTLVCECVDGCVWMGDNGVCFCVSMFQCKCNMRASDTRPLFLSSFMYAPFTLQSPLYAFHPSPSHSAPSAPRPAFPTAHSSLLPAASPSPLINTVWSKQLNSYMTTTHCNSQQLTATQSLRLFAVRHHKARSVAYCHKARSVCLTWDRSLCHKARSVA